MHYYDIFPQIVPADRVSEIRIHPRFSHAVIPDCEPWQLRIVISPGDGITENGMMPAYQWGSVDGNAVEWRRDGDDLLVKAFFAGEQEHNLQLLLTWSDNPDFFQRRSLKLYSLRPDLLALRPWKGETHLHTTGSDGREEPRYAAARYRQEGFDFITITDHRRYEPSLEARDYWRDFAPDFRILPGEEVHAPDNPVHIVNCGGRKSVNELCRRDEAGYRREVEALAGRLSPEIPEPVRFAAASCRWVFDHIRRAGGLAIFAHPYWKMTRTVLPQPLIDAVFADHAYDAVEIIGGFYKGEAEANNIQEIRCLEERSRGNRFPFVAASDSHGTDCFPMVRKEIVNYIGSSSTDSGNADLFGWYFNVVLAEDDTPRALLEGIRSYHSAAVEWAAGNTPHIFGDLRIVRYVSFLLREYFPIHDRLCRAQGEAMLDLLAGETAAAGRLDLLRGRVADRREAFFASRG